MLKQRTFFFAAVSLAAALTLSSCAGGSPAAESSSSAETTVPAATAQLEVDSGENSDAQAMAANIVKTQTAEIAVMAELLATL